MPANGAGGRANYLARIQRQAMFLELVEDGMRITDAAPKVGITVQRYYQWRLEFPDFAQKVDSARIAHKEKIEEATGAPSKPDPNASDFRSFRKRYFGFETYWHQHEIIRAIETAPPMGITMILVPPEHGKTTVLEDYICFKTAYDPNIRVTVVSEGQPHARKILRRIQKRMTNKKDNYDYVVRFGPFKPESQDEGKPWSADYFTVDKAHHDERDYSVEARGYRSNIAGTRTDLLLIDDIQSAKSLSQTEQMLTIFRQDFLTRPGRTGRTIIVGTRVGMGDFYDALIEAGIVTRLVVLPATNGTAMECPKGDECEVSPQFTGWPHEEPLCPELWGTHELALRRKQVDEEVWWRTYQQKPRALAHATFTPAMTEQMKEPMRYIEPAKDGTVVLSLDPALEGGNALIAGVLYPKRLALLDLRRDFHLSRSEAILQRIEDFALRYHPKLVIVEAMAFQRSLAEDERLVLMGAQRGFRIESHLTGYNKLDENLGVASMDTAIRTGEITIPWADDHAQSTFGILLGELHAWRPLPAAQSKKLRQDTVMALWFMYLYWMRQRALLEVDTSNWKRPGLPFRSVADFHGVLNRVKTKTGR